MSEASFKFEKANRSLMERLFEPPAVGKMSPAANVVAHLLLALWSLFVLFPIYWVIITSFKDAATVNLGPFYIPFVDFQPNLDAWRAQFNIEPNCDLPCHRPAGRAPLIQYLRIHRFARRDAPADGAPDLQDLSLAFTNSIVVSIVSTASASPSAPWRPMRWPASSTSPSSATS